MDNKAQPLDGTQEIKVVRPIPDKGVFTDFFTKRKDERDSFPFREEAASLLAEHRRISITDKTHRITLDAAGRKSVAIGDIGDAAAVFLLAIVLSERVRVNASKCTRVHLRRKTQEEANQQDFKDYVLSGRHIKRSDSTELVLLTDVHGNLLRADPDNPECMAPVHYQQVLLHELGHDATRDSVDTAQQLYETVKRYFETFKSYPISGGAVTDYEPIVAILSWVETVYSDERLRTLLGDGTPEQFDLYRAREICADFWMVREACAAAWTKVERSSPDIQTILANAEIESTGRDGKPTVISPTTESFFEFA